MHGQQNIKTVRLLQSATIVTSTMSTILIRIMSPAAAAKATTTTLKTITMSQSATLMSRCYNQQY